eukprot:2920353-Pyramimonas_sp.AAC.1
MSGSLSCKAQMAAFTMAATHRITHVAKRQKLDCLPELEMQGSIDCAGHGAATRIRQCRWARSRRVLRSFAQSMEPQPSLLRSLYGARTPNSAIYPGFPRALWDRPITTCRLTFTGPTKMGPEGRKRLTRRSKKRVAERSLQEAQDGLTMAQEASNTPPKASMRPPKRAPRGTNH